MAPFPTVNLAAALPVGAVQRSPAKTEAMARPGGAAALQPGKEQGGKQEAADISTAIGELVDALKSTAIGLRFEIDDETHRVVTKVIDKDTGELIRQMPTEEMLRIARAIDKLQGLFISHTA
ncbi:flagellar protein FlaG [Cupriavidus oxalaticus]|uniref:Flagellar protein FlaG n=1 Tax=Cupriavidus oxalaticus TaxID=96344 RepID=A0A5P3VEW7_9BURK|nr:flagellar protein FlaG [Cupriavidus oxalaticus]QEZ43902.1 flagellar protein FlaG [Cupriavidus oxalaticus]